MKATTARLLPLAGLLAALVLWQIVIVALARGSPLMERFGPGPSLRALAALLPTPDLLMHVLVSLRRVAVGLLIATVIGLPLGLAVGLSSALSRATMPVFQFLRMISPLSWMPLAVMALGVGDAPIYFLLACAAVWPIALNTSAGVAALDPQWLQLARSLGATRSEVLLQVVLPGAALHVLAGLRLAIGVLWIVLVPAEMLGVSAGLGYLILDARDRLAYSDLMAIILVIGALGWILDAAARALLRRWEHQR